MSKNRLRGLALLEIVVGGLVLSVVLMAVGGVWIQHQRAYRQARNRMMADFFLQSEMERVVAGGYSQLQLPLLDSDSTFEVKRKTAGGVSTTNFTGTLVVTDNPSGSLRKAVVTVSYPGIGDEVVTLSAETDLFWSQ